MHPDRAGAEPVVLFPSRPGGVPATHAPAVVRPPRRPHRLGVGGRDTPGHDDLRGTHPHDPSGTHPHDPSGTHPHDPSGTHPHDPRGCHPHDPRGTHPHDPRGTHSPPPLIPRRVTPS